MNIEQFKSKYNFAEATPVMQQYLDIKFLHLECMLLFRMGDFYELFYEDAITASRILGVALTKRGKTGDKEIAMCGVPHHSLENYLNKLLEEGFKVAICDQTETPEEAKKRAGYKAVVNRLVTRIITPGTIIEESLLELKEPNYLVSIFIGKKDASIAALDLSVSEFFVMSLPISEIINEIARLNPNEILLSDKHRVGKLSSVLINQMNMNVSFQVDNVFSFNKCQNNIFEFYQISSANAIGELDTAQISAIGSIIQYVSLTQKNNIPKLPKPKILNYHKYMSIDASTRRNLEINSIQNGKVKGSLFDCINFTITKGGSRLLYNYLSAPVVDLNLINKRLAITDFFFDNIEITHSVRNLLKQTGDLERCITRLNMSRNTPKDMLSIKDTIKISERISAIFLIQNKTSLPEIIKKVIDPLLGLDEIYDLISRSIRDDAGNSITEGKIIKDSYHPKIAELYDLIENGRNKIEELRNKYRAETGIETLKINNNNVLGLFIDITSKNADKIIGEYFIHRQTTANSVRYTTVELQQLEEKIVNAKLRVVSLEQEIYANISSQLSDKQNKLLSLAKSLSMLDVYSNFAWIAQENNYCKPELSKDIIFEVIDGRHPVVENSLKKSNKNFVHNDTSLSIDERVCLITGPNMAGKSTYLRQNAIIAILAHTGSYVPAKKATIGLVDKVFSRIGSGDDLNKGQSTFMLEMLETSAILTQSSNKSLIILDEVGRGTSTYDGVAIAWAVLEHIHDKIRARCLFATHYHELTEMQNTLPALVNYTVAINENNERIVFLYKIEKGIADKSYGIHVAELAGLPKTVIKKASILLNQLEQNATAENRNVIADYQNVSEEGHESQINEKYKKLFEKCAATNLDHITPREALDLLYEIQNALLKEEELA